MIHLPKNAACNLSSRIIKSKHRHISEYRNVILPKNFKAVLGDMGQSDNQERVAELRSLDLPETFNYLLGLRVRTMKMIDGYLMIDDENPVAGKVLVIWRNIREKNNASLGLLMSETLKINPSETDYAAIYINGDTTLENPHKKVLLTEKIFHDLMFDIQGL